jgi:transposase
MASITKQKMGRYTYLYDSTSYWDKINNRADNHKNSIGRIDNITGETLYKQHYIEKLKNEGKPTLNMQIWVDGRRRAAKQASTSLNGDVMELAREIINTVKDYGVAYFLQNIAEKTGLLGILEKAVPQCFEKIYVLACYLIASDKPVMYCSDWTENNAGMDTGNMSSQRISELLTCFGHKERTDFYSLWYAHIREKEYVALDITAVSSYSQNIDFMEWGYNRNRKYLPQVNVCMLFGEQSMLPIYQTLYSGSLRDVSTLEATLSEFSALTDTDDITLVMDKGFFSVKNVNWLLGKKDKARYNFLLPVSFNTTFAKERVALERSNIDRIENVILTSGTPIRGVHRFLDWSNTGKKLHTYTFFNPEKALKERNELYDKVTRLKTMAIKQPNHKASQKDFARYLNIDPSVKPDEGVSVDIRTHIIEKELETTGWFVLISNYIGDIQTAYETYRAKDIVEKSFFFFFSNLGLNRFHVHSDERVMNKSFVAFIALILSSHIHKVMMEKQMYRHMSFGKLFTILSKLKVAYVGGTAVLRPLTKEQRYIFESFEIELPVALENQG